MADTERDLADNERELADSGGSGGCSGGAGGGAVDPSTPPASDGNYEEQNPEQPINFAYYHF
ncbi:hypothetical protein JYU34_004843 [Plutella xylostella]|uniref:Uncharacterized protein n=1 Tax=Plutella xylostella TaxID=51655 RepID=A0ABQ7QVA8_PLUXY|nr:hypothetical protein JYU34_004843 [Plutella xylostella]